MPKRKKATASDELVMVKSVCRTRSRRMKFCVQRGLGVSLNKQRQGAVAILGHCLPFSDTPENGAKKQRLLFWNLRFSGFLNALGCGFNHDKLFFIHGV